MTAVGWIVTRTRRVWFFFTKTNTYIVRGAQSNPHAISMVQQQYGREGTWSAKAANMEIVNEEYTKITAVEK